MLLAKIFNKYTNCISMFSDTLAEIFVQIRHFLGVRPRKQKGCFCEHMRYWLGHKTKCIL